VLTYYVSGGVRPFIILRTRSEDAGGRRRWSRTYVASVAEARPLTGAGSWAEDPAALRSAVDGALEVSMNTLFTDARTPMPRDESNMVVVQSYFPNSRNRVEMLGFRLAEDDQRIVFTPYRMDPRQRNDVLVLEKRWTKVKPGTTEDPWIATELPD
jgi:hypothetical protein